MVPPLFLTFLQNNLVFSFMVTVIITKPVDSIAFHNATEGLDSDSARDTWKQFMLLGLFFSLKFSKFHSSLCFSSRAVSPVTLRRLCKLLMLLWKVCFAPTQMRLRSCCKQPHWPKPMYSVNSARLATAAGTNLRGWGSNCSCCRSATQQAVCCCVPCVVACTGAGSMDTVWNLPVSHLCCVWTCWVGDGKLRWLVLTAVASSRGAGSVHKLKTPSNSYNSRWSFLFF